MREFKMKIGTLTKVKEIGEYARYSDGNHVASITYSQATRDYFVVVRHIGKVIYAGIVGTRRDVYKQVELAIKKLTVKGN